MKSDNSTDYNQRNWKTVIAAQTGVARFSQKSGKSQADWRTGRYHQAHNY